MWRIFLVIVVLMSSWGPVYAADTSALWSQFNKGDAAGVLPQVETLLQSEPGNSELHDLVGRCLYALRRYAEAINHHKLVLQDSTAPLSRHAWANTYLGFSSYFLDRPSEAQVFLKRVIELNADADATTFAVSYLDRLGLSTFFDNWITVETKDIRFHFQTPSVVGNISAYVDRHVKAFTTISAFFSPSLPKKIDYFVWSSQSDPEMQRITQRVSLGFADSLHCFVWAYAQQSVGHELTHVISYWSGKRKSSTVLINEGISVAFDQNPADRLARARTMISRDSISNIDIKALWNNPSVRSVIPETSLYAVAGYFIQEAILLGGRERFFELNLNQTYDRAKAIYGDDLDKIIAHVEERLNLRIEASDPIIESVNKHLHLAKELGLDVLFRPVENILRQQAYDSAEAFIRQQVLYAANALLVREAYGDEAYHNELMAQAQSGFMLTSTLAEYMERYGTNAAAYTTPDAFVSGMFHKLAVRKSALTYLTNQVKQYISAGQTEQALIMLLEWSTGPIPFVNLDTTPKSGEMAFAIEPLLESDHDELASLKVEVDGQEIQLAQQPGAKTSVVIDTRQLVDGMHTLTITAVDQRQNIGVFTSKLRVSNWTELRASFDKPLASSWFGDLDLTQIAQSSENWAYAEVPQLLFGDRGRKVRSSDTTGYLIWEKPDIRSYLVTLYVAESEVSRLSELVELAGSATLEGDAWEVLRSTQKIGDMADGWVEIKLGGETTDLPKRFRLTLKGAVDLQAVQIGEFYLEYRRQ